MKKHVTLLTFIILMVTLLMTFGYAAFSDQLTITDTVAHVRVYKEVRINGVTTSSGSVSNLDYDSNSVLNTVSIPAGESVTYSVTATNLGSVPVAVSAVSFTNGNGTVNNLSSNVSASNYIKICDANDVCTNGVSKTFDITITNTGSSMISTNLDVNLTFTEVYDISYEGNKIGEALAGSTYTKTFDSPAPAKLAKKSGTCDSFDYTNNILTVINVGSNIEFTEAHTVTYNGEVQGYVNDGATYTYTFDSQWPATVVKESGTSGDLTYENHTITIPNVTSDIELTGTIGKVEITRIEFVEGSDKNVLTHSEPTFHDMNANFSITFQRPEGSTETDFEITYEVDLANSHYNDYIFRGFDFRPTITASADSDTATLELIPVGIANGDTIASETTKTFRVTLKLETNNPDGNYGTSSSTQVDTTEDNEEETGTITATISPTTGDLRSQNGENETLAAFTVNVTSTYPSDREFKLVSSNSNLNIVNSSGNTLGNLTIHGESTEQYTIYIQAVDGATFLENTTTTNIFIGTAGSANVSVDSLTLNVDIYDVPDTTPITVGNIQISMHRDSETAAPTTGQIDVTWDRIDIGGDQVTDYVVQLYNSSNTLVSTGHTNSSTRSYSFTDVADGTYKAVVYGIDAHPNSGESYASASTGTGNGYASASSETAFEWLFNVSVTAQNLVITGNGTDVAKLEQSHTVTVTASGSNSDGNAYIVSDSVTVKMGGTTLTAGANNGYTFTRSNNNTVGTIVINKVTGNIEITASRTTSGGTCLIQGTKVLLANGQYKNIENIDYDDLMLTYSYETGKFVPEYPIWIEKGKLTNNYQLNTFSDGTTLKTYGYHGLYETELKRFVSVDNPDEFHVGSKIAKMNSDGTGFTEVTVTNIEKKYENVYYYQIASTRYFNFIANGLLTTDGIVEMSNVYGFNDNLMWNQDKREEMLKDVFTYQELADYLPYYMFKGLRAEEAKGLINSGYNINNFVNFVKLLTEDDMLKTPIQFFGKNMWMVTTSEDNVTDLNKNNYLRYEGTEYTIPKPKDKNIVGWLNTSDNTIYQPGDNVTVYHGMHFEAIYK